jgi:hypothetical protein
MKVSTILATAAFAAFFIASTAQAECKLSGGGVIQNNDLVRFNTNLNGETQYARTFDDTSWAAKSFTVTPSSSCDAIVYLGSGAHVRVKRGTTGDVPTGSRGVGCDCR